jgi:hypothetical protein
MFFSAKVLKAISEFQGCGIYIPRLLLGFEGFRFQCFKVSCFMLGRALGKVYFQVSKRG